MSPFATSRRTLAEPGAGSREDQRLDLGRHVYHIRLSRDRAKKKTGVVRSPRPILVYRVLDEENVVLVLRVLHDAMDLVRHVQEDKPEGEGPP